MASRDYHSLPVTSSPIAPMSAPKDPFYVVKEKVQAAMVKLRSDFDTWKDILTKENTAENKHFASLSQSCRLIMKTAKSDLNDLNQTIGIVEQHRIKFKDISDSELASRKAFVVDTKGLIESVEKTMDSSRTKSKIERDQNAVLLGTRSVPSSTSSPRGGSSLADRAGMHANDDAVEGERQEMQVMVRKQDEVLDDMSDALDRLSHMSKDIHGAIKDTSKGIDDLGQGVDEASESMGIAMKRMDRLLGRSDTGKYCCILILFILVVLLLFLIIGS